MQVKEHLSRLQRGEVARGFLPVAQRASGSSDHVPYLVARGTGAGPTLWVNAAVHGDESQAVMVAIEFFRRASEGRPLGDVVVTPVANPAAFDHRTKHSPYDGLDMDQSFPGRLDFLATQRVAHILFGEIVAVADAVVNVHTMGPFLEACQYAVYKEDPLGAHELEQLVDIAMLGPTVACRMSLSGPGELPGNIAGGLDYQIMSAGKKAFMLEAGASGGVDGTAIDRAVSGLERLGRSLGALRGDTPSPPSSICRATRRTHVTSDAAGFFYAQAAPGAVVTAGQPLGHIENVFGDTVQVVTATQPVLVIGIRTDPVVHVGDRIGFVATEWDEVDLARKTASEVAS